MGSPFQFHGNCFSIRLLLPLCTVLLLLPSALGSEIADDHERFPVYEACQMKYGYFPPELHDPPIPSSRRKIPTEPQNQGLQECQQMYYRQKFCRNQYRDLGSKNFRRMCSKFNNNHLKFFPMVFGMVGCGAFLRTIIKTFKINLPYTVLLMLIGMALGAVGNFPSICPQWSAFTKVARTPPTVILFVFLPVLIFESSFNMNSHLFFRSFISISILALPGMIITTFSTAIFCKLCFVSYEWTYWDAVLFGSIISATDPVAVVSILKEVGTSEKLAMIVDGESLLNEGMAILFYNIFSEIVDVEDFDTAEDEGLGSVEIILMFMRIIIGGPLFGWIVAKFTIHFLHQVYNDAAVEVSVTLCAAYLTYFIAEAYLHLSGVMALVFLGITLSSERTCISPDVQRLVSHFWEMLTYLTNTVLFVLVGIVITETAVNSFELEDGYYLIFLYFALNLIRLAMIGILSPLLSRIGYGLSWQDMVVMTWGGLRGAVGICLALQVFKSKTICHKENLGPKMLLQTAGIVILTLVVNGTTTKKLLDMLGLTELSLGKLQDMANVVRQIRFAQRRSLRSLQQGRFLAEADWKIVEKFTNMANPYEEMHLKAKSKYDEILEKTPSLLVGIPESSETLQCPQCNGLVESPPSPDQVRDMTEDVRLRVFKALKVSFCRQYEQGILTEKAVLILTDLLEKTQDTKYLMVHASDFDKYWEVGGLSFWLRKKLLPYSTGSFIEERYPLPKEPWRLIYHKIAHNYWFLLLIYLIIIVNMVPVCWEVYFIVIHHHFSSQEYITFYLVNLCFTFVYLFEFVVKVIGIGFDQYMGRCENIADLAILVVTLVEVVVSGVFLTRVLNNSNGNYSEASSEKAQETDIFLKFVRFCRLARVVRILRFVKPLVPACVKHLNVKVNKKIYISYDIGKGFVSAVDDVQTFLLEMIANPKVLIKFMSHLEDQRIEVIRQMGLLEKDNPGIAMAVKTSHASRAVLNEMKDGLCGLKEDGLLDEKEFNCLMGELERKMKKLYYSSPSYMKPPSPEVILANVTWMASSQGEEQKLYEFIVRQAALLTYKTGNVICDMSDSKNGIYVVVRGLVKIRYEPNFLTVSELDEHGIIPNVELFSDLSFGNEITDYFSTGAVIGEIGLLTNTPRAAKVTCETTVTLYHIPYRVMKAAIRNFDDPYDSLEARIWRSCGMTIASSLLPTEPAFSGWPKDKVKTYLKYSAVPIGIRYKSLMVPDFISDVIVIYGQVCNNNDVEEVYTAPCVIPKHCGRLSAKPGSIMPSRLLIIGSQDAERFGEGEDDEDEEASQRELDRLSATSDWSTLTELITDEEAVSFMLHLQSRGINFEPQKDS